MSSVRCGLNRNGGMTRRPQPCGSSILPNASASCSACKSFRQQKVGVMKFEKQLFIKDVLESVADARPAQGGVAIDPARATVAANELAAQFGGVFADVSEATAAGQVLARHRKDDG